ncbi:MAG TPA: hypothetical protein VM939_10380 [Gemmatimonadaceae bacterium]|nr:hypothetical protein [Gemmatimonadaceae bacterium]
MNESRRVLQHFLAGLAYRTQKALRGAPANFADFSMGKHVRTPRELLWHMTGVIGYARTMFHSGLFAPPALTDFKDEITRFHDTLGALHADFGNENLTAAISDYQFLQGPLSDAMTHAGQIAILRRLHGQPVASENFIFARIATDNISADQAEPAAPDEDWGPDQPPHPPGQRPRKG